MRDFIFLESINKIFLILKTVFTPLALGFLFIYGWQAYSVLLQILISANLLKLFLALILWCCLHFIMPLLAVAVFNLDKAALHYRDSVNIYVNRLPARYIPGGIWHTVTRAIDFHGMGISNKSTGIYIILENSMSLGVALFMGGALISSGDSLHLPETILTSSMIIGVLIITVVPIVINYYLHKNGMSSKKFTVSDVVVFVVIMFMFWSLAGLSFYAYINSFENLPNVYSLLEISGTYIFSWAIGFMAVFAPQGIGVTELVAARILDNIADIKAMATLILGFRGVVFMADILVWLLVKAVRN